VGNFRKVGVGVGHFTSATLVSWTGGLPLHVPNLKNFELYPNLNQVASIGSYLI